MNTILPEFDEMDRMPFSQHETNIAVLRQGDIETRELLMFQSLADTRKARLNVVSSHRSTPYGTLGISLPLTELTSISDTLAKFPFGRTATRWLERRFNHSLAGPIGLQRHIGQSPVVLAPRETFQNISRLACVAARSRPNSRVVVSVFEDIPFRYEDDPILARAKDLVLAEADYFIANTPGALDALLLEGVDESLVRLVPQGVNTDLFTPGPASEAMRRSWGAKRDDCVVLFAGRFIQEKGLTELLVAMRRLLNPASGVRLVLQGSGAEEHRLRRAVRTLGIEPSVHFAPWVPTIEMPTAYQSADIVVLPSLPAPYWREQFGYNLVEAMACGKAIVTTRSGEIPWVVGTSAQLVEPYEIEQLSTAIQSLAESQALRNSLGTAARKRAVSMFELSTAALNFAECCEEVLRRPKRVTLRA